MRLFSRIYVLLEEAFESTGLKETLPSKSELLEIYGKLLVNQFDMVLQTESSHTSIGSGLYLGASAIDHSCSPNVTRISNGKELILRNHS